MTPKGVRLGELRNIRPSGLLTGSDVMKRHLVLTEGHVTPKRAPLGEVRACANGNSAISALVGPFHGVF